MSKKLNRRDFVVASSGIGVLAPTRFVAGLQIILKQAQIKPLCNQHID